jgi:hypothetical protein
MAVPVFHAKYVGELEIVDAVVIEIKRDGSAIDFDGNVSVGVDDPGIGGLG